MIVDEEDYLEHFGVLGMKWGVRKDYDSSDIIRRAAGPEAENISETEMAVVRKFANNGYSPEKMGRMYGPPELSSGSKNKTGSKDSFEPTAKQIAGGKDSFELTDKQKEALKTAAKIAAVGVAYYGLNKYANHKLSEYYLGKDAPANVKDFWKDIQTTKGKFNKGLSKDFVKGLSTEPITLGKGAIVTRISSAAEETIRPGGFYAAIKDEDVERYKAVLPAYWKMWGMSNPDGGGHVIRLKAKTEIKAPSPRETFDMFTKFVNEDPQVRRELKKLHPLSNGEALARQSLPKLALAWNDQSDPMTAKFFARLKDAGYTAVLDINDAGSIGHSPMRFLDSDQFTMGRRSPLSLTQIRRAQETALKLEHAYLLGLVATSFYSQKFVSPNADNVFDAESYFEHFVHRPGYFKL